MKRVLLLLAALVCLAHPSWAQQPSFTVDKKLADAGKKLFTSKGCVACHTIGKGKLVGPDLKGVVGRRGVDWIERWLHDPPGMIASDSVAKALRKEYPIEMPNLQLTAEEIRGLVNYLAGRAREK